MQVGFILTKTPAEEGFNTFLKFLKIYSGNDEVIIYLIGNGVYCFRAGHSKSEMVMNILADSNKDSKVYACLDDLKARGLSFNSLVKGVEPLMSYDEMVIDIMEKMDQVFSF